MAVFKLKRLNLENTMWDLLRYIMTFFSIFKYVFDVIKAYMDNLVDDLSRVHLNFYSPVWLNRLLRIFKNFFQIVLWMFILILAFYLLYCWFLEPLLSHLYREIGAFWDFFCELKLLFSFRILKKLSDFLERLRDCILKMKGWWSGSRASSTSGDNQQQEPNPSEKSSGLDSEKKEEKYEQQTSFWGKLTDTVQTKLDLKDRFDEKGEMDNTPQTTKYREERNEHAQTNTGEHVTDTDTRVDEKVGEYVASGMLPPFAKAAGNLSARGMAIVKASSSTRQSISPTSRQKHSPSPTWTGSCGTKYEEEKKSK